MFYARIESSDNFRKILESVRELIPSVNLSVSSSGFSVESSDSLYIVQIRLKIPSSYFSDYKAVGTHTLGVHLPDLIALLKLGQSDDHLILQYSCDMTVIKVSLEACKTPTICEFSLNLLHIDVNACFYSEVNETGKFSMSSKMIHSIFSDLSLISEYLAINLNKMRVRFRLCTDEAGGTVNLKHIKGENGVVVNTSKTFNVEINLGYAKKITKAHSICDRVQVRVYDGEPVIFCYFFKDVELKYYLAQVISDGN